MSAWIDDNIILAQLQAENSHEAFSHAYSKYRVYLFTLAYSILEQETEAQDIVQDFFTDFWEQRLYNNINTSLKNFLFTAVKNRCLKKLAKDDVRRRRLKDIMLSNDHLMPDKRILDDELRQQLTNAINIVPPLSYKVFHLAYIEHKSRKEIADEMGISPFTVKNQLTRALKILRLNLKKPE